MKRWACTALGTILLMAGAAFGAGVPHFESDLALGAAERRAGNVSRAIDILSALRERAEDPRLKARAAGELGAALLQARRLDEAASALNEASTALAGRDRARTAIDLGNLAAHRKQLDEANRHYRVAIELAAGDPAIVLGAELNRIRVASASGDGARLASISGRITSIPDPGARARMHLGLGYQAQRLGDDGLALAYLNFDSARSLAARERDGRLEIEALDALAQLYEDHGRADEAMSLTRQALERARRLEGIRIEDLLVNLEWREGRLALQGGDDDLAIASYQRAVEGVESVRQDIPIEYDDGRSSFRATIEPIYLGFADLLFRKAAGVPVEERRGYLQRIRDVIELIRQAELQDYLRDRCEVEAIQRVPRTGMGSGVAVLYPVVFPDRVELLLETDRGIAWRTSRITARVVRLTARTFASALRRAEEGYLPAAQALYRWLLDPFEEVYRDEGIGTLIVVPEGPLRLVSFGALHDGKRFAIERFAMGTITGQTMTNTEPPGSGRRLALVAGMSVPGGVVDRLAASDVDAILGGTSSPETPQRTSALRDRLALPGVKEEVDAIARIVGGRKMLDEAFTVAGFQAAARSGDYTLVHIASHGTFGGSADTSYIMAFDDLLTMGRLQAVLQGENVRRNPIELLSLSACQTAEGDDRSPLGISGAAVKARAKSVLGTLWPVEDNAARTVMERFYETLSREHVSKVRALQKAQVELLGARATSHPFFWAPFVLIGNWL